jgi:hypothetical protein
VGKAKAKFPTTCVSSLLVDSLSYMLVHASSGLICSGGCGTAVQWTLWFENIFGYLTAHTSYHQYLTPFLPIHQDPLSVLCAVVNDG